MFKDYEEYLTKYDIEIFENELTDKEYNTYLNKYSNKYKVKRQKFFYKGEMQTDNIRCIICKYGSIQPNTTKNNTLLFEWVFATANKGTFWIKQKPDYCVITQGSNKEGVLIFPESKLIEDKERLEAFFQIRKRKRLSDEQKKVLSDRMKALNLLGKNKDD